MALILVAEQRGHYIERIGDALNTEGWRIKITREPREALQVAGDEQPDLAIVSGELEGAGGLIKSFCREHGGPGVLVLLSEVGLGDLQVDQSELDVVVQTPFTDQQLRLAVRRGLSGESGEGIQQAPEPGDLTLGDPQLTSEDIFGEVVAEIESEIQGALSTAPAAVPEPPAPETPPAEAFALEIPPPEADIPTPQDSPVKELVAASPRAATKSADERAAEFDRELEKTLSGLLAEEPREKTTSPRKTRGGDPDIEALLNETLSGLDLGPRSRPAVSPLAGSSQVSRAAASEPAAPTEGARFGQYVLLDRIAAGGMAEVWKARMTGVEGFQKTVAIKRILPHLMDNSDFVSKLIEEAKLAAQLNHPNIIHIYDLGKIEEQFFIAMEFVDGRDLRSILYGSRRKQMPVPAPLSLLVGAHLASALDYAHRRKDFEGQALGIVHRDVSPQNVLISYEGDIKLCDFGIAKAVAKASQTQAGALVGKLQYMSPEQAWGKSVDSRSDIFSLGILLFELMAGVRLFSGDSEISVLEAVRQCRVRAPRTINPEIEEEVEGLLLRALAQNPDERFQTAGEMQRALERRLHASGAQPSQADLGEFLHRLSAAAEAEPEAEVEVEVKAEAEAIGNEINSSHEISRSSAGSDASHDDTRELEATGFVLESETPRRESEVGRWLLTALIVLAVLAAVAFLFSRSQSGGAPGGEPPAAVDPATLEPPPPLLEDLPPEGEDGEGGNEDPSEDSGGASAGATGQRAARPLSGLLVTGGKGKYPPVAGKRRIRLEELLGEAVPETRRGT